MKLKACVGGWGGGGGGGVVFKFLLLWLLIGTVVCTAMPICKCRKILGLCEAFQGCCRMIRKGSKVLNTDSRIVTSQVGSLMLVILSFEVEIETSSFASTRMKT